MLSIEPTPVVVELYEGAAGSTLRIDVEERSDLLRIRALFTALSGGTGSSREFREAVPASYIGLDRLILHALPTGGSWDQGVTTYAEADGSLCVRWAASPVRWDDCAAQVDGLIEGGCGHQYYEIGADGPRIVIALGER